MERMADIYWLFQTFAVKRSQNDPYPDVQEFEGYVVFVLF